MKKIAWILVLVGALNWGLVGLGGLFGGANWNIVNFIFGGVQSLEAVIYVLVGASALVVVFQKCCGCCKGACSKEACSSSNTNL